MTSIKTNILTVLSLSALTLSACGEKKEPKLPTFDPMTKVKQKNQGYSISGNIAVDSNNTFYHSEHLLTNYYNFDAALPPASLTAVEPSCNPAKAKPSDDVHVIIARGGRSGNKLANIEQPSLITFANKDVENIAKDRAEKYIKTQTFKAITQSYDNWPKTMSQKDIIITESAQPVYIVIAGRWPTLYNFTIAPYAKVAGVMVYSDEGASAVAGLNPSIPVNFQSAKSPQTKRCWVRTENKPDETWRNHKQAMRLTGRSKSTSPYHALKPHYRKFASKIRKDVGSFTDSELINVQSGSYFLIGPAPTLLEQRIPYSPVAGSHIKYLKADQVNFGMRKDTESYAYDIIHSRTEQILQGGG